MKNTETMTKEQLATKILKWENDSGESFTDYFMHDHVKNVSWAFWLLGKGFHEFALVIIRELEKGEKYIDQETLYEIHSEETDSYENHEKNVLIWAEFLVATDSYVERVTKFFEQTN